MIEIGTQVVENEKIQTTGTGSVQVLFIDKTTLNVGPNSTLVIDRFVYNPATTRGELAVSLSKGVLRVVGGIATHSEGATIRTPVAAIGLRGGIAIISHSGAKGTQAILGFGHMSVTAVCGAGGGNCNPNPVQVSRPGFGVNVAGFNRLPSSPGRVSGHELAQSNSQLTSQRGQSGGASQQPTDNLAQSYNVGTPNSPGARVVATTGANAAGANALQAAGPGRDDRPSGPAEYELGQNHTDLHRADSGAKVIAVTPPFTPPFTADPPVVPPPIIPPPHIIPPPIITPPAAPVDLRDGHQRAFPHHCRLGLDPEPRALSHRRLRRNRRLHGL